MSGEDTGIARRILGPVVTVVLSLTPPGCGAATGTVDAARRLDPLV